MINLDAGRVLGQGRFRKCFEHPFNSDYIVKVQHGSSMDSKSAHKRELDFYSRISGCKDFFPIFVGEIQTNLGEGLIFKKISNEDGSDPKRIFEIYPEGEVPSSILSQIQSIMHQLEKDALLTCAVNPENILIVKCAGANRVVCCDVKVLDIREFLPISKIKLFRRLKVKRRNRRLLRLYI